MGQAQELRSRFRARFGAEARVYRAPGRINLIGEHTDYNDGFVMPAAIGFYCWVAISPRDDHRLVIHSEDFSETVEADFSSGPPRPSGRWSDYPVGVAVTLERAGLGMRGANVLMHGDVPIGAGLSSSAAVEVATAEALLGLLGRNVEHARLARLCQRAENKYVGARCGIMDQFVSLHGREGRALMLDCRSLDHELLPIPDAARLVVCNTMVKHELASNGYNHRRAECEDAVARLSRELPGIRALRDVSLEQLTRHRAALPDTVYRRALHVASENARVGEAAAALRSGDLTRFGQLMADSHASLRDLYEVSCAELDLMVELARGREGVYGARMTGGGFGGSTINLVEARRAEDVRREVAAAYEKATGMAPQIHICAPSDGAGPVPE